jgi:hypothetical protein
MAGVILAGAAAAKGAIVQILNDACLSWGPIICGTVAHQAEKLRKDRVCFVKDRVYFDSIGDFWGSDLKDGEYVSIKGALSKYAPMLIGPPKAKREVHRAYRRSIAEIDYKNNKTVVDPYLAFTAGQMVWRLDPQNSTHMYLGLYHSIVRNSIPVFIDKNYYLDTVERIFSKGKNPYVVEAQVNGRLQRMSGNLINGIINNYKLSGLIKPEVIDTGKQLFGIMVDGQDTDIRYSGVARYLDGDIWVAVELNGEQFFVSRFIDLADPVDLEQESQNLMEDVKELFPKGEIIFQFDQVDKLITGYQKVTVDDLTTRFGVKANK